MQFRLDWIIIYLAAVYVCVIWVQTTPKIWFNEQWMNLLLYSFLLLSFLYHYNNAYGSVCTCLSSSATCEILSLHFTTTIYILHALTVLELMWILIGTKWDELIYFLNQFPYNFCDSKSICYQPVRSIIFMAFVF